jgi:hypothetical protein
MAPAVCDCCRQLDAPVDWDVMRRLGSKAAVVFNPADPWSQPTHTQLAAELPGIEVGEGNPPTGQLFVVVRAGCAVPCNGTPCSVPAS